jgi:copper(I)-binding protein
MTTTLTRRSLLAAVAFTTVLGVGLAACGDDDDDGGAASGGTAEVTVTDPWARTSPMDAKTGAIYMTLEASEADTLTGASVDMSVAMEAQIHETKDVDGEMKMSEVGKIELPAGEAVDLKPGGYHIMLMGLKSPLEEGQTVKVTLTFDKAGEKVVDAAVRSS